MINGEEKKNTGNFVLYCRDLGVFQISDLEIRRRIGGLVSCRKDSVTSGYIC